VVERFLPGRDQLALVHHDSDGDIRTFIEELGGRQHQHAVLLSDVKEPVLGEADAIGNDKIDRRGELLDLVGDAVLVAIGDHPDVLLARAHEGGNALRPDGDVPRIRHDRIKFDLEPVRQFDAFEILAQLIRVFTGLFDGLEIHRGAGRLHPLEFFHIVGSLSDRMCRSNQAERGHAAE